MITINIDSSEYYDETRNQFVYEDGRTVRFEYSLKALYEWEGKWLKPFLKGDLNDEEIMDFYKMMALDPVDDKSLTSDVADRLAKYISESNTATTFSSTQDSQNENKSNSKGKVYTSEELYALMIMSNIPIEFETRNLNRLLTILKIISAYNNPPKKMNKQDIYKQNASLNAQRKAQLKSKG